MDQGKGTAWRPNGRWRELRAGYPWHGQKGARGGPEFPPAPGIQLAPTLPGTQNPHFSFLITIFPSGKYLVSPGALTYKMLELFLCFTLRENFGLLS